ncbi:MAG: AAA family ATPase [Thermodesulfobacteriota bacterium]
MSYYKVLGLKKEPFSTSPDPSFFYPSREHRRCLSKLQISVKLKRGFCAVFGDVGIGKTTICRCLIQALKEDKRNNLFIILNPYYSTEHEFLQHLARLFYIKAADTLSSQGCIEAIEEFLFRKTVVEDKNVILLIDEAQKLVKPALEVLRVLLNFETNENKMLQLILLSQMELLPVIGRLHNLWDRIGFKCIINPLSMDETRELINFRVRAAVYANSYPLVSESSIEAIYDYSRGYPRKTVELMHNALEYLVMHQERVVDTSIIQKIISEEIDPLKGIPAENARYLFSAKPSELLYE